MIAEGIIDWGVREVFLDELQGDVYGQQVTLVTLSPNIMRRKVSSHIPVNRPCILSHKEVEQQRLLYMAVSRILHTYTPCISQQPTNSKLRKSYRSLASISNTFHLGSGNMLQPTLTQGLHWKVWQPGPRGHPGCARECHTRHAIPSTPLPPPLAQGRQRCGGSRGGGHS